MMQEKQYLSRSEVVAKVNPNPVWLGDFDKFKYEKIDTNLQYCLHTLHTCWNLPGGRYTFINLAKKMKASLIELDDYSKERIAYFTGNYHEDIIYVSAFRHKDLKTLRENEYKDSTLPDNVYIAEDHNHRFTSYALNQVNKAEFRNVPVVLYLGKILD